ncbi:extensin-like [Girardinichthys multiradiatus]|uniref:extensin-like n=1 Tax=Girardinichthys multiradiatus TaxID=208333 RepID=UPI001FAC18B9|nr:extensin-like [Girardinichthys multiradiatus]
MHALQTIEPGPPGAARQSSKPRVAPPRPPPCPRKRHKSNKWKGGKERPQHAQQRGHTPPRDAEPPTSMPANPKRQSQAKLWFPPSQRHSKTTHSSIHRLHKTERPNATTEPSKARPAVQNTAARVATHRTTTPTPQHAKQRRTKPCEKTHTEAHKRQRAHRAKTKTHQEAETSPPRDQPRPACLPNHADPSNPPPPDRTGTGVKNQNLDKEPESKPEPPRSKRCPSPPKTNHPLPWRKKTPTFEQVPEHIRH